MNCSIECEIAVHLSLLSATLLGTPKCNADTDGETDCGQNGYCPADASTCSCDPGFTGPTCTGEKSNLVSLLLSFSFVISTQLFGSMLIFISAHCVSIPASAVRYLETFTLDDFQTLCIFVHGS